VITASAATLDREDSMNTDAQTAADATPNREGHTDIRASAAVPPSEPDPCIAPPQTANAVAPAPDDLGTVAPLLVVGSISADELTPPHGTGIHTLGGAGLYAALGAAAVAGRPVTLAGAVGSDIATDAVDCLRRRSVHPALSVVTGPGLRFAIRYDTDWQAHYTIDGAAAEAAITYPIVSAGCPLPAAVHLCPTGPPEVQLQLAAALRAEHGDGLPLSATTFSARIRSDRPTALALWSLVDLMVCDVHELRLLTRRGDLHEALHRATQITGRRVTCVTDAARGAYLITEGIVTAIPAYPSATIDPTGAGESFAGALAAAHLAGHGLVAASAIAAAVASLTVEAFGVARLAQAGHDEITRRATALAGATSSGGNPRG
jgi:sugar/nucleoside kinase (ribokinase family)